MCITTLFSLHNLVTSLTSVVFYQISLPHFLTNLSKSINFTFIIPMILDHLKYIIEQKTQLYAILIRIKKWRSFVKSHDLGISCAVLD